MKLIQILMEWHKNSLDIRKTYKAIEKQLTDLRNYHKEIPFDPSTGEFHACRPSTAVPPYRPPLSDHA